MPARVEPCLAKLVFKPPTGSDWVTFQGVYDALDFLENEWPRRNGKRYKRACDRCRAALQLRSHAHMAREAFVSACIEAGMPVEALPPVWQRAVRSTPAAMNA